MLQVMQAVAHNPEDETRVSLLYANRTEQDILLRTELEELQQQSTNIAVSHILSKPSDTWTGLRGRINSQVLQQHLPRPADRVLILVCGPPAFHTTMTALLTAAHYPETCVFHF